MYYHHNIIPEKKTCKQLEKTKLTTLSVGPHSSVIKKCI